MYRYCTFYTSDATVPLKLESFLSLLFEFEVWLSGSRN